MVCKHVIEISWKSLHWRHNEQDGISNHQPHDCLLNRLFRHSSKKTSKLRVTGLCAGNSPKTGEFPAQRASNAKNVSIWWRHHVHYALITILMIQSGNKIVHVTMAELTVNMARYVQNCDLILIIIIYVREPQNFTRFSWQGNWLFVEWVTGHDARHAQTLTWGPFHERFSIVIQIQWQFHSALIQVLVKWSLCNFAHGMTAVLFWDVQNFVVI